MTTSLKEALDTALAKKWAEDDAAHKHMEDAATRRFSVTNNVSRKTFDEIKQRPGTRTELVDRLTQLGYKKSSITSLITQMLRVKMVGEGDGGYLYALVDKYRPLGTYKKQKKVAKRLAKPVVAQQEKVEERQPVSVSSLLDTLSVLQARALYDELKQIFGEAK